jgi:hypothetical protein
VSLQLTVLDLVRQVLGMMETSRNRGPEIDEYHRWAKLDPSGRWAWCCSGLGYKCEQAAKLLHLKNPFPVTASCAHAWRHIEPICKDSNPEVGALYFLRHSDTAWHVGIVESCEGGNVLSELSGNTFAEKGGREGNQWARHWGPPEVTHGGVLQGYAMLDRAAQPAVVLTS